MAEARERKGKGREWPINVDSGVRDYEMSGALQGREGSNGWVRVMGTPTPGSTSSPLDKTVSG